MMKTLKYIVLLTVVLVNMTPYIKDGKVEWKTTQAQAQNYVYECRLGVYFKCVNSISPYDWFLSDDQSCEKLPEMDICSICHKCYVGTSCTCNSGSSNSITLTRELVFNENIVRNQMQSAWNTMINSGEKIEYGFRIYFNKDTREYSCGPIQNGAAITCGQIAKFVSSENPNLPSNMVFIGLFHTHPNNVGCDTPRIVGPSTQDNTLYGVMALVWDFRATSGNLLYGTDDLDDEPSEYYYGSSSVNISIN